MKHKMLFQKGKYALLLRGEDLKAYAVVYGYNEKRGDWDYTCGEYSFEYKGQPYNRPEAEALANAVDCFRLRTEENYISRFRLEELATQLKDGLIEADEEFANEYFDEVCEMSEDEKEWFEIEPER